MSSEQNAAEQKRTHATPAEKTDAPRRVRDESVREFKLREPLCITPDTIIAEALERMRAADADGIFVCQSGRAVGLFSEHDLIARSNGERVDTNAPVKDWIQSKAETLPIDATLGDVVQAMNERGCRHISILEDGKFVGSISDLDIITYLAESYPKETMNLPPVAAQVMDTQEGG